jgi:hypothetical protein
MRQGIVFHRSAVKQASGEEEERKRTKHKRDSSLNRKVKDAETLLACIRSPGPSPANPSDPAHSHSVIIRSVPFPKSEAERTKKRKERNIKIKKRGKEEKTRKFPHATCIESTSSPPKRAARDSCGLVPLVVFDFDLILSGPCPMWFAGKRGREKEKKKRRPRILSTGVIIMSQVAGDGVYSMIGFGYQSGEVCVPSSSCAGWVVGWLVGWGIFLHCAAATGASGYSSICLSCSSVGSSEIHGPFSSSVAPRKPSARLSVCMSRSVT